MIEILRELGRILSVVIWLLCELIVIVGALWVLRIAVDWWLGIDYVVRARDWWFYVKNKISGL